MTGPVAVVPVVELELVVVLLELVVEYVEELVELLVVVEVVVEDDGRVKAIYIMGENPLLSDPNLTHVRTALEAVELLELEVVEVEVVVVLLVVDE